MTVFLAAGVVLLLSAALSLVVARGIRVADERAGSLPARLDPRALTLTAAAAQLVPSRKRLTRTGRAVGWLLVAAFAVAALLVAGHYDYIAAGGTP